MYILSHSFKVKPHLSIFKKMKIKKTLEFDIAKIYCKGTVPQNGETWDKSYSILRHVTMEQNKTMKYISYFLYKDNICM